MGRTKPKLPATMEYREFNGRFYSDSIIFRPYTNNNIGWQGIWFNNDSLISELSYCLIDSSSGDGIRVNDSKAPQIYNCTFQNNFSDGIFLRRSEIDIYNFRFQNNNDNGIIVDNGALRITNSILSGNAEAGIFSVNTTFFAATPFNFILNFFPSSSVKGGFMLPSILAGSATSGVSLLATRSNVPCRALSSGMDPKTRLVFR